MTKSLQQEGITYEKYRQRIRAQFIVRALRQKNVSSEIIVSPHKVESYYAAHRDEYKVEDEVKLRMIVLYRTSVAADQALKEKAREIVSKLDEGAVFSDMATLYSEDISCSWRKCGPIITSC
jgi:peptidyl-prolyl cis-trans isomerase SurA